MNLCRIFLIAFTLLMSSHFVCSQSDQYRLIRGRILGSDGKVSPGQNIMIWGSRHGTVSDINGEFCLIVPLNKEVILSIPCCFEALFREVGPNDKFIRMAINKRGWKVSNKISSKIRGNEEAIRIKQGKLFADIEYQSELRKRCLQ